MSRHPHPCTAWLFILSFVEITYFFLTKNQITTSEIIITLFGLLGKLFRIAKKRSLKRDFLVGYLCYVTVNCASNSSVILMGFLPPSKNLLSACKSTFHGLCLFCCLANSSIRLCLQNWSGKAHGFNRGMKVTFVYKYN